MNDYFLHLIEKSKGRLPAIRPRLSSRYEPGEGRGGGDGHESEQEELPAAMIVEDTGAYFPEQSGIPARERLYGQSQAPIRIPERELPENPLKAEAGRTASPLPVPVGEVPELNDGGDGICPLVRSAPPHRQETAGFPVKPLPLPGGKSLDPAAHQVNYPRRSQGDPVPSDPRMGRVAPHPEIKTPSAVAAAGQKPERSVIRQLQEMQPGGLMPERPALTTAHPAPAGQTVRVTIGRIDVRALMPHAPSVAAQKNPAAPEPKVSLEAYLKKQWGARP
jgi:hypothetical protein